jgi:signal transduction histidine kinase
MTHEIMNSIAPISSLAETLQAEIELNIEDSEKHPLDTNDLYLSIKSIQRRSEGLMNFSKSYRGLNKITTINARKVYVRELFDGIYTLIKSSLRSKGVDLQFKMDSQKLQINMDTALIEQVLINLIMNSVDACTEVAQPKITVSAKQSNQGYAIIKVTDNGKGIPEELIDKIFIPFFSSKKNGSGIGLSLCQQIMFLHKGKIQVNSVENSGTVIQLVFKNCFFVLEST